MVVELDGDGDSNSGNVILLLLLRYSDRSTWVWNADQPRRADNDLTVRRLLSEVDMSAPAKHSDALSLCRRLLGGVNLTSLVAYVFTPTSDDHNQTTGVTPGGAVSSRISKAARAGSSTRADDWGAAAWFLAAGIS